MKTKLLLWPTAGILVTLLLIASDSLAQTSIFTGPTPTNMIMPVVTIQATHSNATWSGTPGVFTVTRTGNPAPSLYVYYVVGGTAVNGVDYQTIGHWVPLPSGVLSGDVVIRPINNGQSVTKTVTLQLAPSPLMGPAGPAMPVNYRIGYPSNATVYISPGRVTNIPPAVRLAGPPNGAVFYTPVDIPIVALANDVDGFVASVEFFANNRSLGIVTNPVNILPPVASPIPPMPPYRPFVLVWSNAPPGTNIILTARATDNGGASSISDPVSISVRPGPPPPPTNFPPIVRITSPPNNSVFRAPVDLPIFAYAADRGGYVTMVGFFAGTNFLGLGHRVISPVVGGSVPVPPPMLLSNLWLLIWSNAPVGAYPLTAVAADNGGASTVSDPVNVTILPPPPPPTNRPPVVSIIATDPIAIEGTNCCRWLGLAAAPPAWSNWQSPTAVFRYLTNCGPKNALFTVRRLGATNADLTITYDVGGTATNGVDYVPLPGVVTIPAGHRAALITLVPLDDGPPDLTTSVILKLTPSSDYLIGYPPRAAAIILDGPCPRPTAMVLPDRCFCLSAAGPDGAWFHVEASTDMRNWAPICTNQVINGSVDFVDPDAQSNPARFYRAVPEDSPAQ